MFDVDAWDKNEWIDAGLVQEHFEMSFSECFEKFGFCRHAEWNAYPLNGQKITCYFRKYE